MLSCFLQAMVEKFSSISTRKLPKAVSILTRDKKIIAMSDHGEFYKMVKRSIMVSMLGASAQVWMGSRAIIIKVSIQVLEYYSEYVKRINGSVK